MKRCIPCLLSDHGPRDFDIEELLEDEHAGECQDEKHNPLGEDSTTKRSDLSDSPQLSEAGP